MTSVAIANHHVAIGNCSANHSCPIEFIKLPACSCAEADLELSERGAKLGSVFSEGCAPEVGYRLVDLVT